VIEWDGSKLATIQERMKWFLNSILTNNNASKRIVAQGMGTRSLFSRAGVFELVWDGREYQLGNEVLLPNGANLYGFTLGSFTKPNEQQVAIISAENKLMIFNASEKLEWKSMDKHYGGSKTVLDVEPTKIGEPVSQTGLLKQVTIEQNLVALETQNESLQNIAVVRNQNTENSFLNNSRDYNSTAIDILSWENGEATMLWSSGALPGYISSYVYDDITNDGSPELVAIQVEVNDGLNLSNASVSHLRIWPSKKTSD
jgi:hypothetical protein